MNGLTKLGTILTVMFLVSLLALVAKILYVLWRRQKFRRRSDPFHPTTSKEQLIYLFCWKNQTRIEPAGNPQDLKSENAEVYGPSRVLFTIEEEEREGTGTMSEAENEIVRSKTVSFDQTVDDEPTPPFYTPSPSPTHNKYIPGDEEAEIKLKGENDVSFVSLEVKCICV